MTTIIVTDSDLHRWVRRMFNLTDEARPIEDKHKGLNISSIAYNVEEYFPGMQGKRKLIEYVMEDKHFEDHFYTASWDDTKPKIDTDLEEKVAMVVEVIIAVANSKL